MWIIGISCKNGTELINNVLYKSSLNNETLIEECYYCQSKVNNLGKDLIKLTHKIFLVIQAPSVLHFTIAPQTTCKICSNDKDLNQF